VTVLGTAYVDELRALGERAGLAAVGVAAAEPFTGTLRDLRARRAAGLHDDMAFTYRSPERSTDPARAVDGARALAVGAWAYAPPATDPPAPGRGAIAAYAVDDHYGRLRAALGVLARRLRADGWRARVLADDNALVDREAARRAGLGWYGKSSNLLLPGRGSWFVLGAVVTDAPLPPASVPVDDGCGTCRRCLDGCPTGAIVAPGVVDARRCLAWRLQAGGSFPIELREALGGRVYGCDDCQAVCPENRRAVFHAVRTGTGDRDGGRAHDGSVDLVDLLELADDELLARHGRWYIAGRDPDIVRRNALVALANTASPDDRRARQVVARYRAGPDELLREHAAWADARLAARRVAP
jgi:epoxyqueuosine reductase